MHKHLTATNLVAALILAVAGLRMLLGGDASGRFDETTLLYLCAAAAVFLLARAKAFKFGELELELQEVKAEVSEAKMIANIAQDASVIEAPPLKMAARQADLKSREGEGSPPVDEQRRDLLQSAAAPQAGVVADDPWKGVFGGSSIDRQHGRMLSAEVMELKSQPGWYAVSMTVHSLPGAEPLQGAVQFFLHDTFRNNQPLVEARNGVACLHLKAWGAFTVGALCDEGECQLELDLAQLDRAPLEFRSR